MKKGKIIKMFRFANKDMSVEKLAEISGLDLYDIIDLEEGLMEITDEHINVFAAAFGVEPMHIRRIANLSEERLWSYGKVLHEISGLYIY